MNKSFSLIEVLIAVTILSVVITSVLKMREHNLDFLNRYKELKIYNDYISLARLHDKNNQTILNTNIYLNNITNFKDDKIRKELKTIKVYIKNKVENIENIGTEDFPVILKIVKQEYKIEDKIIKNFYTFKLDY
jgi:type II secretory pathway pseudopilin PulG